MQLQLTETIVLGIMQAKTPTFRELVFTKLVYRQSGSLNMHGDRNPLAQSLGVSICRVGSLRSFLLVLMFEYSIVLQLVVVALP